MEMKWRILVGLALVYAALDPFKYSPIAHFPEFQTHFVEDVPWSMLSSFMVDKKSRLQEADVETLKGVWGPESIAFDPQNRGPYTGIADGTIVRWDGPHLGWSLFAFTSPNRSEICNEKRKSALGYVKHEHICGRPLGLRFNKDSGDLYIADAYFGLLVVGPQGGLATPLVNSTYFANDLDIDKNGNVYFTDSSAIYRRKNFIQLVFSMENTGRVLKYDPHTKEVVVLVSNVSFPNGLCLSKDESFFVYTETVAGSIMRYWLKGPKSGTTDIFARLPGYPDNIRVNDKGEFWVAIHGRHNHLAYFLASHPKVRMFLLRLPISARIQYITYIGGKLQGMVAKYSPEGELLELLEDRMGKVVKGVSEVEEKDGKLWMGSVLTNFIALY
ncbi:hypothetical protein SUGI_0742470 [Cryptomeria japonica]|uniref:protein STRICTOSIDINE SYNTHASE-LIKE 3 n=1 Tax=Cryptomeria japonica TaxID=3369 RepID=UPI0024149920|nr:protein STRICTOSIDINE SYNTHASE-LIKE 3 [Cryptomeria japonica]GLJ36807.1 hypothetical protein SUGI_0742470 [Cryptomeria japonica]